MPIWFDDNFPIQGGVSMTPEERARRIANPDEDRFFYNFVVKQIEEAIREECERCAKIAETCEFPVSVTEPRQKVVASCMAVAIANSIRSTWN
jgi:hypothetical protein